jgi:hypothetical protein
MDLKNAKHFKDCLFSSSGRDISNLKSKPSLPKEIQEIFPEELVRLINSFVPKHEKKLQKTPSPNLQRELTKIQNMNLKGSSSNYMYELDDFLLD